MKIQLSAVTLVLLAACSSAPDSLGGGAAHEQSSAVLTLKHHDGRVMANQMRLFLMDTDVRIKSDGATWEVTGAVDDVDLARYLAAAFDTPTLTRAHRAVVKGFEGGGAKQALSAARARADWGDDWVVGADSDSRWLAMIPNSEMPVFSEIVRGVRGDG